MGHLAKGSIARKWALTGDVFREGRHPQESLIARKVRSYGRLVIVPRMTSPDAIPPDAVQQELEALSRQVDRLLDTVRRLGEENRSLRHSQEQLAGERANLLARNDQARSRVEAMIQRLKSLEGNG
jgi:cell division protein ZapB